MSKIKSKVIRQEEFSAYIDNLNDILKNVPMTVDQRSGALSCIMDIEWLFRQVNN